MELSRRINKVEYAIRDVEELARKYPIKYHLNIGDPIKLGVKPYKRVLDSVREVLEKDVVNGYAPSQGVLEARKSVSEFYKRKDLTVNPDDVFITSGVSEGIHMVIATLMNRGDRILLPRPNYPLYDALAKFYGLKVLYYDYNDDGKIDWGSYESALEKNPKLTILINPNNPLGTHLGKREVRKFLRKGFDAGSIIIADEIYSELIFKGEMYEAMKYSSRKPLITMNGISKSHVSPGWRLGWMVLNKNSLFRELELKENLLKIAELRLSAVAPLQYAMAKFLNKCNREISKYKRHLKENAQLVEEYIGRTRFSVNPLTAAHYAFIKTSNEDKTVHDLARKGVLVVPGKGFSKKGYFRIVTAGDTSQLESALKIITKL